jgi:hypothetical protein
MDGATVLVGRGAQPARSPPGGIRHHEVMSAALPKHPQRVDPPQRSGIDASRIVLGFRRALLAHLIPSGLTAIAIVAFLALGGPEALLEGAFFWVLVLIVLLVLQTALALGCLIAVAVAAGRGDSGLGLGYGIGWLAGLIALAVIGCVSAAVLGPG